VANPGRIFGLVGGLGVGATVHFYQQLVAMHERQGRTPRLLIAHADVGHVLERARVNDLAGLAEYLNGLLRGLAAGGAEVAALGGVTPHICMPELAARAPLPLIDAVAEVARAVRARGLRRVALFGTRVTVETGLFGGLPGVDIVQMRPDELDAVHTAYVATVKAGRGLNEHHRTLTRIAHTLCAREGAQAIVLAGTELSLVFDDSNTDFPAVDGARVHLDAIMERLLA
jgi:aspartate racemase